MKWRSDRQQEILVKKLRDVTAEHRAGPLKNMTRKVFGSAYIGIDTAMRALETITWWSAYKDRENRMPREQAIAEADNVVERNYPSHDFLDKPAILRDTKTTGMLIWAWTYFGKMYSLADTMIHPSAAAFDKAQGLPAKLKASYGLAAKVGQFYALLTITHMAASALAGRGPEQDETWAEWALRKTLTGWTPLLPGVGGFLEGGLSEALAYALHGKYRQRGVSTISAPVVAGLQRIQTAAMRLASQKRTTEQKAWDAFEVAATIGGLPMGQVRDTGGFITGTATGRIQPHGPFGVASGTLYGARKNQAKNLLTTAGELAGERPATVR
jgi:hypothetical protein